MRIDAVGQVEQAARDQRRGAVGKDVAELRRQVRNGLIGDVTVDRETA